MHIVILHYCNVIWLNIPLWIYGKTSTLWGFFNMGITLPKLHQVIVIAYNNGPNFIHGRTITSFDANHKVTKWFLHQMNGLVLFRRYTQSLDILEFKCIYSLFAPHYHWKGMYAQVKDIIVRCEQCDRVKTSFSSWQLTFFPLFYLGHVLLMVMWFNWRVTTNIQG
jgi:hypothetical protein